MREVMKSETPSNRLIKTESNIGSGCFLRGKRKPSAIMQKIIIKLFMIVEEHWYKNARNGSLSISDQKDKRTVYGA